MAVLALLPTQTTYIAPEPVVTVEEIVATEPVKDPEETFPGEECNCYLYTKNRVIGLPKMAEIEPVSEPFVNGVAIEWFGKIKHISVITEVTEKGVWVTESNYTHCKVGTRFIPYDSHRLVGFWVAG